jgi:hypothetical protein
MKSLNKTKNKLDNLKSQLGIPKDYTRNDLYKLWKESGLTIKEVAEMLYRSPEQARKYCYGYIEGRHMRLKIGDFFKNVIKNNKRIRKTLDKI